MRERKCDITGKRKNSKAMNVPKSLHRTHRVQQVNLQTRRLWWAEEKKWVRLRIATKTYRTILKNGLDRTARKYGVNLNKFSLSFGKGPTLPLHPAHFYQSAYNGTLDMRPRYAKYLKDAIKYSPHLVAEELLPNFVPKPEHMNEPTLYDILVPHIGAVKDDDDEEAMARPDLLKKKNSIIVTGKKSVIRSSNSTKTKTTTTIAPTTPNESKKSESTEKVEE
jgi:large subunit ribosomal protein L28